MMERTGIRQDNRPGLYPVLTEEHHRAGLSLEEEEDFLFLYSRDEMKAVFSTSGATVQAIREEADRILCMREG